MSSEKSEVLQRFVTGNITNLISSGFIKIFSLLTYLLILSFLSVIEAGMFFTAFALSQLLVSFLDLGVSTTIGRLIPVYDSKNQKSRSAILVGFSLAVLLLSLFVASTILLSFSGPVSELLNVSLSILTLMVFFLAPSLLSNFIFGTLTGMREFNAVALFRALDPFFKLVFTISAIYLLGFGATEAFMGLVFGKVLLLVLMGAFSFLKIIKHYQVTRLFDTSVILDMFEFCSRVYVTSLTTAVISQIDTLSLATFSPAFVAPYNAIKLISNNLDALTVNLHPLLASALSYFYGAKDMGLFLRVSQKFIKFKLIALGPLSLVLLFFSKEVMELIFPQYADAYWVLYLLIPLAVFSAFAQTYRISILAIGRPGVFSKLSLALVLPALALYVILASNLNALGVILAYVITNAAFRVGHIYYGHKLAGIRVGKETNTVILILLVHFVALLAVRIFVPLSFTLGEVIAIAFFICLEMLLVFFFSKTISREDFKFLRLLTQKNH